jgi:integrase/recombinase XerD
MQSVYSPSVEKYLQELSLTSRPSTIVSARQILREFLAFVDPRDIRQSVINYLADCKKRGLSMRTIEHRRIRLVAFYKSLDVKLNIPRFRFVKPIPEVYTAGEIAALLKHARDPRQYWLFRTLWQGGLREQEARWLEYADVTDVITVRQHGPWTPKTHSARRVVVPHELIAGLKSLPPIKKSPLVFPNRFGRPNNCFWGALKQTAEKAGLDPAKCFLHKFRTTFCTGLLRGGLPLMDVQRLMGHRDLASTQAYMALLPDTDLTAKIEALWK